MKTNLKNRKFINKVNIRNKNIMNFDAIRCAS